MTLGNGNVLLSVRDLTVEFKTPDGTIRAVDSITYDLYVGETLAVVGESGSGKSVTALAVLGLVGRSRSTHVSGEVWFEGRDILKLAEPEYRKLRGRLLAMIFQDPLTSLNPGLTIGFQIAEAIRIHRDLGKREAAARAVELLTAVGIPNAAERSGRYPHEFSGGMRQRALIAMAIANHPRILIADEPTTALDVTIQAQVLELLKTVITDVEAATILITHDLGVVAETADRVLVLYAGQIVETADVRTAFHQPRHPYTLGLLTSLPRLDAAPARLTAIPGSPPSMLQPPSGCRFHPRCEMSAGRAVCRDDSPALRDIAPGHVAACHFADEVPRFVHRLTAPQPEQQSVVVRRSVAQREAADNGGVASSPPPLVQVDGLSKWFDSGRRMFRKRRGSVRAVDGVSFDLVTGQTLGMVGESGSGKSTTARLVMRLLEPSAGRILYKGTDITQATRGQLRRFRRECQMVFQDPFGSLDPRMTVGSIVSEPLRIHGWDGGDPRQRVSELLAMVGLSPEHANRYPRDFSGGQRQRIGIARALALNPDLLVLDEPVSALDVSIQAQILNLLADLQSTFGLAYLLIAHDLAVVKQVCHRIAVMYLGRIVEVGDREHIYGAPAHPYTQALLSAVPITDPAQRGTTRRRVLGGEPPDPSHPPSGCRFRTRCWRAEAICAEQDPALEDRHGDGRLSACHFSEPTVPERPATPAWSAP